MTTRDFMAAVDAMEIVQELHGGVVEETVLRKALAARGHGFSASIRGLSNLLHTGGATRTWTAGDSWIASVPKPERLAA